MLTKTSLVLLRRILVSLAFAGFVLPALPAEGSPPLITDDPGTPGEGHWEINLGVSTERRAGLRLSEMPMLDFNYGIGDTLQLKYEVPYLVQSEDGQSPMAGLGNCAVGLKWRFHDAGAGGLAMSVYPQFEFNHPGSSSAVRGLVQHGSAILLPMQFEKGFGSVILNVQLGRELRSSGDAWFYGIALSRAVHEKIKIGMELAGTAAARVDRTQVILNLGLVYDVDQHASFMVSVGRELHNHADPCATLIAYIGWQFRR